MRLQRRMLLAAALPPSWATGRAHAQARRRVVVLGIGAPNLSQHLLLAQVEGLRELGFVDARNVALECRLTEPAFEALRRAGVKACFVVGGPLIYRYRQQVAELELRHRLPAIHYSADYLRAGGLLSYGTDLIAQFRRSAYFIARILSGAKPAELPVEQPARFETAINLASARALGLTVPPSLLLRADVVIQ